MKILKTTRRSKKVLFEKSEAFIAYTKEGIIVDMPNKIQVADDAEWQEKSVEIQNWIDENNPFLNDFITSLEYIYGENDNYDSSHLDEDIDKREVPPDYIVSDQLFIESKSSEYVVVKDSQIHGVGLFASKDIKKGEFLQYTHIYHYILKCWVNLNPNFRYNHSSKNDNCEVVEGNRCMKMIALRDIYEGEELLVNYANNDKLGQPAPEWH